MCTLCLTMICMFSIDAISLADQVKPTDTDPKNIEIINNNSKGAVWLEQTEEKCKIEDFPACSELAAMYKSLNKAKKSWFYYNKACTGLHAESCATIGRILSHGDGLILDKQAGHYFYGKACDLGDT